MAPGNLRSLNMLSGLMAVVVFCIQASGMPPKLAECVPEDVVAAWFVDSRKPESGIDSLGIARFVIDQAGELGLLSQVEPASRAWIDTLAALSVLLEYPHAVALFHVEARRLPDGGHRLAQLNGALIAHTNGKNTAIEERIQRLLNAYANQEDCTLTPTQIAGRNVFELRDQRVDDWAVISWGAVGDFYVVAIGEDSLARVAETMDGRITNLTDDAWYRSASSRAGIDDAWLGVWADFRRLESTADAGLAGKVVRVRRVLGLHDVQRGLWTVRSKERAVQAGGLVTVNGRDEFWPLTTTNLAGIPSGKLIPPGATGYAVFETSPRRVLGLIQEAYMASRSDRSRIRTQQYWRSLQVRANVDVEREIFANLGEGVIIHDYPRHALRLPLLWTIVAPIRSSPDESRAALDRLFTEWQSQLHEADTTLRLRRDPDGLWYLFIGINGPAIGLSDHWLVLSFSPQAVRENLQLLPAERPNQVPPAPPGLIP